MSALTKIDIITRPEKSEILKEAMNSIGITGMTVTQVLGCGNQKGRTEMYRGVPYEISLLPKVKFEIVVSEVPVETVVEKAKEVLKTGEVGDGKIFIYEIGNAIKIRTGEEGVKAL
jgi:nitrogen regulatory protein P-II 1